MLAIVTHSDISLVITDLQDFCIRRLQSGRSRQLHAKQLVAVQVREAGRGRLENRGCWSKRSHFGHKEFPLVQNNGKLVLRSGNGESGPSFRNEAALRHSVMLFQNRLKLIRNVPVGWSLGGLLRFFGVNHQRTGAFLAEKTQEVVNVRLINSGFPTQLTVHAFFRQEVVEKRRASLRVEFLFRAWERQRYGPVAFFEPLGGVRKLHPPFTVRNNVPHCFPIPLNNQIFLFFHLCSPA